MNKDTKVLVINGQSMYENNSTGITLKSILNYFKNDNVLELHYFPVKQSTMARPISKSIKMNLLSKPIYYLISKIYKGNLKNVVTKEIDRKDINDELSLIKIIKRFILGLNDYTKTLFFLNKKQFKDIDEFNPDIIYTLGASIQALEVSRYMSKKYDIPIVLHHMDNWRETAYNERYSYFFKKKLQRLLNEIEEQMKYGLVISEEMAKHYNEKVGQKYIPLMNTVPTYHSQVNLRDEDSFNIVYAGGLHLNRWKSLIEVEEVIKDINKENITTKNIQLLIFTKESDKKKYENLFSDVITTFEDFLPIERINEVYENADISLHIESFDRETIEFTKYSLSTKIPEYMANGKPILCYAPHELSVYKYIEQNGVGFSSENKNDLKQKIMKLNLDSDLRYRVAERGLKIAMLYHSDNYLNKVMDKIFNKKIYNQ